MKLYRFKTLIFVVSASFAGPSVAASEPCNYTNASSAPNVQAPAAAAVTLDELAKLKGWERWNDHYLILFDNSDSPRTSRAYLFIVFERDFPVYRNRIKVPGIYLQHLNQNGPSKNVLLYTGSEQEIWAAFQRFCDSVKV